MQILDPGHAYLLTPFDGEPGVILRFMKREGEGYPGNVGHYSGTNLQEVIRACIDRLKYLDTQIPHWRNKRCIIELREVLENLEFRAAERHGRVLHLSPAKNVEDEIFCYRCGCTGHE